MGNQRVRKRRRTESPAPAPAAAPDKAKPYNQAGKPADVGNLSPPPGADSGGAAPGKTEKQSTAQVRRPGRKRATSSAPVESEPKMTEILPGDFMRARDLSIPITRVPALLALVGARADDDNRHGSTVWTPARRIFTTGNEDGTHEVLTDLMLVEPEALMIKSRYVRICVIDFDSDDPRQEDRIRTFLANVEPVRRTRTTKMFSEDASRGLFNDIAPMYASGRGDHGKYINLSKMLSHGQLAPSSHHRNTIKPNSAPSKRESMADELVKGGTEPVVPAGESEDNRLGDAESGGRAATPDIEESEGWEPGVQLDFFAKR
jgi:hypothetical protein